MWLVVDGNTGEMFFLGEGVPQDYDKALEWYLKAAKQGDIDAQVRIGKCIHFYAYIYFQRPNVFLWARCFSRFLQGDEVVS